MKMLKTLLVAVTLGFSAAALADPPHDHDDHDRHDGPEHHGHYARGEHIDEHFRDKRYAVANYSHYHLHAPPRGYHWVRDDDNHDFVLAAIATGIVAEVVANQH